MKYLLLLIASLCSGQCIVDPCRFTTNIPYDAAGTPDNRPDTWGSASYDDAAVPFTSVPAGYRVRILSVSGDFVAGPHGVIAPGTWAGTLLGLLSGTPGQSPFVLAGMGSSECFLYLQLIVDQHPGRAPFNVDVNAPLGPSNTMWVRRAVWENSTGVSIHMEPSLNILFKYELATATASVR